MPEKETVDDIHISEVNIESQNKIETLSLINGSFSPEDAYDILVNLFSDKIRFHELRNFSSMERLGVKDEMSIHRLSQLKAQMQDLKDIIGTAKAENVDLVIKSDIQLSFVKKSHPVK